MPKWLRWALVACALVLHGCGSIAPTAPVPVAEGMPPAKAARPPVGTRLTDADRAATLRVKPAAPRAAPANNGRYFDNDGPGEVPPEQLQATPEPTPRDEPLAGFANRNYVVFGRAYTPETGRRLRREEGIASWYGRKFHGRKTATGEKYDMYAMTAAHPTLPLPSFVRVTNLETQKTIVVRVNDRGPFLRNRIIDLSYAAAAKLGFARKGSARVAIETIMLPTAIASASGPLGSGLALKN